MADRKYTDGIPLYENLSVKPEYFEIVEWMSTPANLREPKTQKELAEKIGMHETTLSRSLRAEGVYGDIRARIKQKMRGEMPNVLEALKEKILKDGSAKEVQLFLQWVDDFTEKQEVKHVLNTENPEVKKLIESYETQLKEVLSKKE